MFDSGSDLPARKLQELNIRVIPFTYEIDGVVSQCPKYPDGFDGHHYYTRLKEGAQVKTSLINSDIFYHAFLPEVQAGNDVMYVGISSGISGTIQSAVMAAVVLEGRIPGPASSNRGLLRRGPRNRSSGMQSSGLSERWAQCGTAAIKLNYDRDNLCEYFTVDDLIFLKRTGRVSRRHRNNWHHASN